MKAFFTAIMLAASAATAQAVPADYSINFSGSAAAPQSASYQYDPDTQNLSNLVITMFGKQFDMGDKINRTVFDPGMREARLAQLVTGGSGTWEAVLFTGSPDSDRTDYLGLYLEVYTPGVKLYSPYVADAAQYTDVNGSFEVVRVAEPPTWLLALTGLVIVGGYWHAQCRKP